MLVLVDVWMFPTFHSHLVTRNWLSTAALEFQEKQNNWRAELVEVFELELTFADHNRSPVDLRTPIPTDEKNW